MFTAITSPDMIQLHRRLGSLGLLLLLGVAYIASKRPASILPQRAATKPDTATCAHIVDEVEPLYRALFPKKEVLRFTLAFGFFHPHKGNETRGWMIECYDNAGNEIAHGLWDEHGKRHITVSVDHRRSPSRPLPFLSAEEAVQTAKDWLYRTGMAIPQGTVGSVYAAKRWGEVWHVTVRLSDGVVMVWINAHTGEVHQAIRDDRTAMPSDAEIHPCAP